MIIARNQMAMPRRPAYFVVCVVVLCGVQGVRLRASAWTPRISSILLRARALLMGALLVLGGCATASFETLPTHSFAEIQKAIGETFPRGISEVSSNQREYTSKYFRLSELGYKEDLAKTGELKRAQALVIVLGDRRPYKIEVSTHIEVRNNEASVMKISKGDIEAGQYDHDGSDGRLAKRLAERIQDYLYRRSQNKNFIDDFRPF